MSTFESRFATWVRRKKAALDEACGKAIREGLRGLDAADLKAANASLSNLYAPDLGVCFGQGSDCDYSLRGVGALYTGHWHGKRVHDSLSFLVPLRSALSAQAVHIVDVGAGTGAVLWAWTLVACCAHEIKSPLPVLSWTSLDSSAEMLAQGERLWTKLCELLPDAPRVVHRKTPILGDWKSPPPLPKGAAIIGSYVFSRQDSNDPVGTAKRFAGFANGLSPSAIMIWAKKNKSAVLDHVKARIVGLKELPLPTPFQSPLSGDLRNCQLVVREEFSHRGATCDPQSLGKFIWGGARTDARLLWMLR